MTSHAYNYVHQNSTRLLKSTSMLLSILSSFGLAEEIIWKRTILLSNWLRLPVTSLPY